MIASSRSTLLALLAVLAALPAHGARIPISKSFCQLPESSPTGAAYDPVRERLVLVNDGMRAALAAYAEGCELVSTIDIEASGVTAPTGVAYAATVDGYAVVDGEIDALVLLDALGTPLGQCSLGALGVESPSGITAREPDLFAITDALTAQIVLVNLSTLDGQPCELVSQFDGTAFGAEQLESIEYMPSTEQYVLADTDELTLTFVDDAFLAVDTARVSSSSEGKGGLAFVEETDSLFMVGTADIPGLETPPWLTELDVNGTLTPLCDLQAFASTRPQAVTYIPARDEIAFTDQVAKRLYMIDAQTCAWKRAVDTSALGIDGAAGMSYRPRTNQLVIADTAQVGLYFVAYSTGQVEGFCDLQPLGFSSPGAVAVIPGLDLINVVDQINHTVVTLDSNCELQRQHALELVADPPHAPVDSIAYGAETAITLVGGRLNDEIFVLDNLGRAERSVGLIGAAGEITGLASLGDGRRFIALDFTADELLLLDMPILREALTLSGTFSNDVSGLRIVLHERGKGRLTGVVQVAGAVLPAYGQFDAQTGEIVIAYTPLAGAPVASTGSVSDDLNTIVTSGPLGTLQRQ